MKRGLGPAPPEESTLSIMLRNTETGTNPITIVEVFRYKVVKTTKR
jgi:hypothetical protein